LDEAFAFQGIEEGGDGLAGGADDGGELFGTEPVGEAGGGALRTGVFGLAQKQVEQPAAHIVEDETVDDGERMAEQVAEDFDHGGGQGRHGGQEAAHHGDVGHEEFQIFQSLYMRPGVGGVDVAGVEQGHGEFLVPIGKVDSGPAPGDDKKQIFRFARGKDEPALGIGPADELLAQGAPFWLVELLEQVVFGQAHADQAPRVKPSLVTTSRMASTASGS